jgi:Domain of unknown function (DUF4158)
MPRRSILSAADRESLLALPDNRDDLIRRYTLTSSDIAVIRQRRGPANRLGFAVQLSYLRYPGVVLGVEALSQTSGMDAGVGDVALGQRSSGLVFEFFTDECDGFRERTGTDAKRAFDDTRLAADILREVEGRCLALA